MAAVADAVLVATSPAPKVELNAFENLLCGFVTGTCTRTLTSPFDVVKILLQVNAKGGSASETIAKLWREDGIKAFWRGNFVGCLNQGPQSALKFLVLENLKKLIGKEQLSGGERALMGACAGIVSQTCVYPVEFIHTRILLDPKKYHGIFQTASTIIREEGITAFWSGIAPTIAGSIPFEGSQFFTYDTLAQLYKEKVAHSQTISPVANCAIGAIAGAISQTVAFPFDVVRKRMMAGQKMGGNLPTTMGGAFKQIYQNEGVGGFFKGLTVNMVKIIPYSALQYTIFAETKKAVLNYKIQQAQAAATTKKGK
ncbi:hydrogenosomal membrane protein 31 precursor [Tritrichomonas foetus]|uniref:Hydrogenosomal membrane protein 31 n=1 Tax=Tritrichomonas foetus TaxID=1144522 RepID=A0A1J4JQ47_9EUKA|nr:hydrogenosomal membrane protein 31 precursor [Tritrichomonas foetus]|eukprot:OHS99653.1 hydrogenosomal membrane protein 31 precursor [Tritrichomonas foetus]